MAVNASTMAQMSSPLTTMRETVGTKVSAAGVALLTDMLTYDWRARLSAQECLMHSFFRGDATNAANAQVRMCACTSVTWV